MKLQIRHIILIDETPIRRQALRELTAAAAKLDSLKGQWSVFIERDQPAYENWIHSRFDALLSEMRECAVLLMRRRTLLETVQRDALLNNISYREAYELYLQGQKDDQKTSSKNGESDSERVHPGSETETARELFDDQLRDLGIAPESLEGEDYEDRFRDFSEGLGLDSDQPQKRARPAKLGGDQTGRLKTAYRALVRLLHPDRGGTQDRRTQSLWLQVQSAYEEGDVSRLEALLSSSTLFPAHAQFPVKAPIGDLLRTISGIKKSVNGFKKQMRQARKDRAWGFSGPEQGLKANQLYSTVQRELKLELAEMQEALVALDQFFEDWLEQDEEIEDYYEEPRFRAKNR